MEKKRSITRGEGAGMYLAPTQQKAHNFLVLGVQTMKFFVLTDTYVVQTIALDFFKKATGGGAKNMHL